MVYDEFRDNADTFSELETRLSHLQPLEVLYPQGSSRRLEQMLMDWKLFTGRCEARGGLGLMFRVL